MKDRNLDDFAKDAGKDVPGAVLLLRKLLGGFWVIAACAALALILATLYLRSTPRIYTAELKVTAAPSSQLSKPGQLGGLGGLASIAGLSVGSNEGASPFDLYLDALTSRDIAADLANDPVVMRKIFGGEWNARTGRWEEPTSFRKSFFSTIYGLLGVYQVPWSPPDADRMRDYLAGSIAIDQGINQPITRLRYSHPDADFAVVLLTRVNRLADQKVRRAALKQATADARYLALRMRSVQLAEHRQALAESLAEQERSIMLASSGAPFSATPIDPPLAGRQPTSPRSMSVIIASVIVGLLIGALVVLTDPLNWLRRARKKSDGDFD